MYCIKCGVELGDGEKRCPLCQTRVYHPEVVTDAPPLYPPHDPVVKRMNRRTILFLLAVIVFLTAVQFCVFDLRFTGGIGWSYYAAGGAVMTYLIAVLPMWFRRPNPVVFVPVSFATALAYLLGVCLMSGGNWFLPFAFPAVLGVAIITTAILVLVRYVKRGYFYISGGASLAVAAYSFLLEELICVTFGVKFYFWSLYPIIGFAVIGIALIVVGIVKPFQRYLAKKFFI